MSEFWRFFWQSWWEGWKQIIWRGWCWLRWPKNDVRHYGARGDGQRNDTAALQRAVNSGKTNALRRNEQ